MFKRIVYYGLKSKPHEDFQQKLKTYCEEFHAVLAEKDFDSTLKPEDLQNAEVLVSYLFDNFNKKVFSKAKRLRYIIQMSTDISFYDQKFLKEKNIKLINITDYSTEAVAELTLAILFSIARNVCNSLNIPKKVEWCFDKCKGFELENKKIGIIGAGNIGSRVAKLCKNLGMNVSYYSRRKKEDLENKEIHYKKIEELLKENDIISLHLQLNEKTKNFLNQARLNMLKKGAIILNPSRGELCDLEAIYKLAKEKKIIIWFDSIENKEKRKKLINLENVLITPHCGWMTKETQTRLKEKTIEVLESIN